MELQNEVFIEAPPAVVFRVLTDPEYLLRTMPGLKELTPVEPDTYAAVLELGVAAIRGRYTGTMRIVDADPPHRYRLDMDGKGPGAFVKLTMDIAIAPQDGGSAVSYQGSAQVGGTIAGVAQRVMGGVANMVLGQFFEAVRKEAVALAG